MTIQIIGRITSTSNAEALDVLNYFQANYAGKTVAYSMQGNDKTTRFGIEETTLSGLTSTMTNLINQYGDGVRLIDWEFQIQDI